jgi:D-alanyl-D-alanine carboxypeptidase
VSPEVLDKYVGVYSSLRSPGEIYDHQERHNALRAPPGDGSAVPLEATAQDKFKLDNGTAEGIVFEFNVEKNQMIIKRGGGQRVFTKEK